MIDGVQVYARIDKDGKPSIVDAIDQDEAKIRNIADQLFRRGFGVMRQRKPRAGKVFYLLKAALARAGRAPQEPVRALPAVPVSMLPRRLELT